MGYLIDTTILSELQKGGRCNADVQRWYVATDGDELFLSVLVIGEIRLGIERLRRRDAVQSGLEQKLLAATALEQDLTLVTRNVRDVEHSGVRLLNPFSAS